MHIRLQITTKVVNVKTKNSGLYQHAKASSIECFKLHK